MKMSIKQLDPRSPHEYWFKHQSSILLERGLATERELLLLLPLLRKIKSGIQRLPGEMPFLIVVPKPRMTFKGRMARVRYEGQTGISHLEGRIINITPVPRGPYLAVDVWDGREMSNMSRANCEASLVRGRLLGTALEGVTLVALRPDELEYSPILLGSRQRSVKHGGGTPWLGLGGVSCLGVPKLYCDRHLWVDERQGPLSCGARYGLTEFVVGGETKCHPY